MKKSLLALYEEAKSQPTAAQLFVQEVADVTKRSVPAVRNWLNGRFTPDALAQEALAQHFGTSAEELFGKHTTSNQ